ncbi:cysteine hydrolase family protein [Denitromonas iodatirespirans]|uniref:Cysteine hydrolase n=1 Tax=Denitromonas iodatirespirans TaxID=2795389 RepID=A0A944D9M4_DENI1|nr:cysteine hydrolase family protein [Denitromonas iodatirespirans]MBT0962360.1 cysteine hydrolase [Denitromonas iodatirespirans]
MNPSNTALVVIDLQNDYFADGGFPLWNADETLANVEAAIHRAQALGMPVVLVQHVADASKGISPFFNADTPGVDIHPRIRAAAPDAPVVVKSFADAFHQTTLESTLQDLGVTALLLCGMMTQNCVTHTALSRTAERYQISVIPECCTTVSQMLHLIALNALSTRMALTPASAALA